MRSLVFALGAVYFCVCFAPNIYSRCLDGPVDVYYTRDRLHFHWDWKADRISVAESKRMESTKFTPMPLDPRDWPKWLTRDLAHESAEYQMSTKDDKKATEPYSLHAIDFEGMRWKPEV